jgi:hypothetical protein
MVIATLILGALIGAALSGGETAPPVEVSAPATGDAGAETGTGVMVRYLAPDDTEIEYDDFGSALPTLSGDNFFSGRSEWRQDTTTFEIPGDGSVEYKAVMDQGDSLTFRWSVDGGQVYYDMHGHDAAFGEEFFTRYEEGEGTGATGTIIAPYAGEHGWFWLNLEADPITITLDTAGFYERIVAIELESGY